MCYQNELRKERKEEFKFQIIEKQQHDIKTNLFTYFNIKLYKFEANSEVHFTT